MPDFPVFPPAHVLATLLRRVWLEDLLVKFWRGISSAFSSISIATREVSILSEMEKRVSRLKKANGLWRAERSEAISRPTPLCLRTRAYGRLCNWREAERGRAVYTIRN